VLATLRNKLRSGDVWVERSSNYDSYLLPAPAVTPIDAPGRPPGMPDAGKLTPGDPNDLAAVLGYALRHQGRKRIHNADESHGGDRGQNRLIEHLEPGPASSSS